MSPGRQPWDLVACGARTLVLPALGALERGPGDVAVQREVPQWDPVSPNRRREVPQRDPARRRGGKGVPRRDPLPGNGPGEVPLRDPLPWTAGAAWGLALCGRAVLALPALGGPSRPEPMTQDQIERAQRRLSDAALAGRLSWDDVETMGRILEPHTRFLFGRRVWRSW